MFKLISIDPGKCKCGLVLVDMDKKKVDQLMKEKIIQLVKEDQISLPRRPEWRGY